MLRRSAGRARRLRVHAARRRRWPPGPRPTSRIAAAAVGWPLDRMAVIDRLVLRLAVSELLDADGPRRRWSSTRRWSWPRPTRPTSRASFVNGILVDHRGRGAPGLTRTAAQRAIRSPPDREVGPVRPTRTGGAVAERERSHTRPLGGVFVAHSQVLSAGRRPARPDPHVARGRRAQRRARGRRPRRPADRRRAPGQPHGRGRCARSRGPTLPVGTPRRGLLPRRHRPASRAARGGDRHPVRPDRARSSCSSTTCCSPGAPSGPPSTP